MLRGFFLLHYVHHLIFRCVLFVSSGLEFVLFQSLHQYLLCAPVDLYFSEDAQLGQYGACRQPLYRCVFCQRLSEKDKQVLLYGIFHTVELIVPVQQFYFLPSYQYRKPLCSSASACE